MRLFSVLFDWFCQRLFWLCVLSAAATTARADVILWNASISPTLPRQTIAAGESATTYFDLGQAAYVSRITLNFSTPGIYANTGTASLLSVWLDSQPGSRERLLYSGYVVPGFGVSEWLPAGRKWITVDALPNSRTFLWLPSDVNTGFHTNSTGQTVATAGFAGLVSGTPVPEPSIGIAGGVVICVMGAIGFFRRMKRGNKCSGTR